MTLDRVRLNRGVAVRFPHAWVNGSGALLLAIAVLFAVVLSRTESVAAPPEKKPSLQPAKANQLPSATPNSKEKEDVSNGRWSKLGESTLSGRLVVSSPKITASQQIDLMMELRSLNLNGVPRTVVQTGNPLLFSARVASAEGKSIEPTMSRVEVLYSPKWTAVNPLAKQPLLIPLSIRSSDGAKGSQLDTTTKIWKLPPGKYKISGTYTSPPAEVRKTYNGKPTPWTGKSELPPVDIEIVDADADGQSPRNGDPIEMLLKQHEASLGLWINGISPLIELPGNARPEEILEQAREKYSFNEGRLSSHRILKVVDFPLKTPGMTGYRAALIESNLGTKILLFKYEGKQSWWTRFYDVPTETNTDEDAPLAEEGQEG